MNIINYPLLYFQMKEDALLGILIGAGIEAMAGDLRSLKATLLDYLQKRYKKYDDYPIVDLKEPRLRMVEVGIRPAYRDKSGSYPMSHTLQVRIPAVYGQSEQGHYECYLPLANESFYYYDPRQFEHLVQHAALSLLTYYSPEQLHRLLRRPRPHLDTLSLKVNFKRNLYGGGFDFERKFEVLNRLAEAFPPKKNVLRSSTAMPEAAWEREGEVREVVEKLLGARSNVLVVGRAGTGKSAVLRQAIKKITSQSRRQHLDFTFWRILPQRITASTKYLGEWEELCEKLAEELQAANGILWVENVAQLLQIGGEGPEDSVGAFLRPLLQRGMLQIVGEASPQEIESMRRLLPGFAENFQVVLLEEMEEKKAQAVLREFAAYAGKNLRIHITEPALQLAYQLLLRHYPYEGFPGKGIRFLGHCISEAMQRKEAEVGPRETVAQFARQTGLPELFLRDDLLLDVAGLYQYFNSRIIGQPAATEKLAALVKIYKAGLNNPYKPISTLIFAGPTGVGKTASAKALADYFFGKGQRKSPLIRIDMSEFQYPGQIVRLIGSGREPGQLAKEIRERPFAVLLLDEAEKADPSIFDALLGVLDEGLLLDAYGREANFRNTIIIMTTNLGAGGRKSIGFQQGEEDESAYLSAINHPFRPEFINRIDSIVVFRPLGADDMRKITLKELEALKQREGLTKRGIEAAFTDRLASHLAGTGFDERYGARPLQRSIEQQLVIPIANWLLANPKASNCRLVLDYDGKVTITSEKL